MARETVSAVMADAFLSSVEGSVSHQSPREPLWDDDMEFNRELEQFFDLLLETAPSEELARWDKKASEAAARAREELEADGIVLDS